MFGITPGATNWRLNRPLHSERHIKVICIGAGASGLLFAYKLQRNFENFELTIYEKNKEVGGTWWENKYPGCACDVPSHNYTFSFEPKLDWSAVYAGSDEIFDYFNNFSIKYGLRKYIKFAHQIVSASWDNMKGEYDVQIRNHTTGEIVNDHCHILVNAGGILNAWRWPAIPGLDKYKGRLLHTADWDRSISTTSKTVGLIGNGSSGIQVLPAIQSEVKHLITFIREPTYVSPVQGLSQRIFSLEERRIFETVPGALLEYRKNTEWATNELFPSFLMGSQAQISIREYMIQQMKEKLQNKDLEEKLIPNWPVGCRRMTPGVKYLETLAAENVSVVYGDISEVTENGCVVEGVEHAVDILICATGFDTTFKPRFALHGLSGENLQDSWEIKPHSYLGVAAADFPNYFMFLGPNCPIGNGPCLIAIEAEADWMMQIIDRFQTHNIHCISPKKPVIDDFIAFKDEFMKKTVWNEPCRSWYKANQSDAPVTALWPGSTLHYLETLRDARFEDFEVQYVGSRFDWLGNGATRYEHDKTCDTAFYLAEKDESPYFSRAKRVAERTKPGTVKRGMSIEDLRRGASSSG